jgi:hypothetical protein
MLVRAVVDSPTFGFPAIIDKPAIGSSSSTM